MGKKIFYTFFIVKFLFLLNAYGQINKNGIPFIKNYPVKEYKADEQNWAVCSDNRGVVYFGNSKGILEFDGSSWRRIDINNKSIVVRSLAVDSNGTIYVGAIGEFGYLAPDLSGEMEYNSLYKESFDTLNVGDVWRTYINNNEVFFCAGRNIFKYRDKKLEKIYRDTIGGFISFFIKGHLYTGNYYHGLKELNNNKIVPAKGGNFYKEKDIFVLLPFNENELFVGTMEHGHYLYNVKTGKSRDIKAINKTFNKLSLFLNEALLYNGLKLKNNNLLLTTINKGAIIINNKGEILNHFTKENGLADVTVTSAYESDNGILWLSLFNSLSYIELNTPFAIFDDKNGIDGMIMDVERFNGTLYIATSLGLYYQYFEKNGQPKFELIKDIEGMVWTLEIIELENSKKCMLAGSRLDVYQVINHNNINNIGTNWINCKSIYQDYKNKNTVYVVFKDGISSITFENGKWKHQDNHKIFKQVESVTQDNKGCLWLGTSLNGIIRYDMNRDSIISYGIDEGLPFMEDNTAFFIHNNILIATKRGLYYYNAKNDSIIKCPGFGGRYLSVKDKINHIYEQNDSIVWVFSQHHQFNDPTEIIESVEKITVQDSGFKVIDIPFNRLNKYSFMKISFNKEDNIWFATSSAAINYNSTEKKEYQNHYHSLIRQVNIQVDSVIFWGTNYSDTSKMVLSFDQPDLLKYSFDYKHNIITFNFSSPYYPVEDIKYSFMLDGFDDNWSPWDIKTEKEYTNLREGKYTFKVKAKNIYGIESEVAKYEFTIMPPWYRTLVAYILYFILAVLIVVVIVKVYTRRLELEKIRLEQIVKERTEEVVKQKDEIEKQRDEIADKNRSITDSIEYAKRIQAAVLPSEEFAKDILPEHFILFRPRDIVSGDFYWMTKKNNLLVLIAADCTGHGVPGAFMSMLGVSFLNEIVNRHEVTSASAILNSLRTDIKKTLGQEGKEGEAKDGMDIALCTVDLEKMKLQYAGAYNPFYLFRNNELIEVKADRMPIGIYIKEKESFTNHEIDLQKDDVFYIFSDGYQDQFGGEDGSKFKTKNFKQLLLKIHHKPMSEQHEILNSTIDEWRGKWEQVDDIIIMGVRV